MTTVEPVQVRIVDWASDEAPTWLQSWSMNMKWIWVIVLVIIGALATFVAIEYLTVAIHALPSYIPGHKHGRGHYRKRGALAAVIAVIAFVVAAILAYRIARPSGGAARVGGPAPQSTGTAADQLVGSPPPTPGEPAQD